MSAILELFNNEATIALVVILAVVIPTIWLLLRDWLNDKNGLTMPLLVICCGLLLKVIQSLFITITITGESPQGFFNLEGFELLYRPIIVISNALSYTIIAIGLIFILYRTIQESNK